MLRYQKVLLSSILALAGAGPLARAQEPGSHARIVRISYLEGTVQFNGEKAVMNTPVTEGSRLVTGTDGLAEVQFEDGSAIRMASETEITFAQLARLTSGEALTRVDLDDGEAEFLITGSAAGQFAVNVRSKNVLFKQPGRFRLLSTNSDPLEIAVWKGEAGVRDRESGQEVTVNRNETFTLNPADPGQFDLEKAVVADDLDQWSTQRDQYLNSGANASTYVSSNNAGYSPSFYPSSYYSYYPYGFNPYGFNDFNSCSPFFWGGGFGGQPYWLSPGGGYCWNSGFFFPWNPFINSPVVILVPPVRRLPPHIHPPTVPVVARAGAPPVGVKPGLRSFKFDGVQRVFNEDNFPRSVTRSEGIQPGGRTTGERVPQTAQGPAGEAPRVNSHPVQPLMAPGQRPANNGSAQPAHSAPAPPPRSSMPSTSTVSRGFSSPSSSSSHSSSSSSGGRHR